MRIGIVGLPNAGKSTLFNALTASQVLAEKYPFCTIEPNVGVVPVPDPRLEALSALIKPQRTVPVMVEFVDIAGLVAGASRGEGLGNQFLAHIREMDALVHVVRCFSAPDVSHVSGELDARQDVEIVETELALADLESVKRRVEKVGRWKKTGEARWKQEETLLARLEEQLQNGIPVREMSVPGEGVPWLEEMQLLTAKPVLLVANLDEAGWEEKENHPVVQELEALAGELGAAFIPVAAQVEAEVGQLPPEERHQFLRELGVDAEGLEQLVHAAYSLLGLITFFTVTGGREVRAWKVPGGTRAGEAAGQVHTSMQKGFIRAEVVPWDILLQAGSLATARGQGLVRLEGKDYPVQDGDVMHFRFQQ